MGRGTSRMRTRKCSGQYAAAVVVLVVFRGSCGFELETEGGQYDLGLALKRCIQYFGCGIMNLSEPDASTQAKRCHLLHN